MTLAEFRAFLDGLALATGGAPPNAEQWAEVLRRLALVAPDVVSAPIPTPLPQIGTPLPMPPLLTGTVPWGPLPITCTTSAQDFVCWN